MLRRILCTLFCLSSLAAATFALDAETRAPVTDNATVEKKRATHPKETTNAQRFKSTRVGQVPLNQRVEVHQGVFQAKKKRHKKAKIKKLRLQPKERLGCGGFKKKHYSKLEMPEHPTITKRKRVGRIDYMPVARVAPVEASDVAPEEGAFSMADLNEFQYREDRSTEPGIPVQVAGGEQEG